MTGWRLATGWVLIFFLGVPLAWPFLDLFRQGQLAWTGHDLDRLLALAGNTLFLVAGTLGLALPLGVVLAIFLFRTDLPLRSFFRFLVLLALFVPLPVLVSAWQALLGADGWFPSVFWPSGVGRRWAVGLGPAIWVHALAALPWIILLVGQGLCWVEVELEEDSLLAAGNLRVLWLVTLPRCRGMILAACVWTGLFTASEIAVTEMMQVSTFAEEVRLEFAKGGGEALARAVLVSLPLLLLCWLGLLWLAPRLQRSLPPLGNLTVCPRLVPLGWLRWPFLGLLLGMLLLVAGVPLLSLTWKLGLQGEPLSWSAWEARHRLYNNLLLQGPKIGNGLLQAFAAGMLTSGLALVCCWAARAGRCFRWLLLGLVILAWTMPGPLIGIGLKEEIMLLVAWFPHSWLADWFYDGPSPLPGIWAYVLRFFPCAVAILWPIVRLLPPELYEVTRLEGGRPDQELFRVTWPLTWPAFLWASGIVMGLSLGEIAASNRVEPPASETFAHLIFERMHYGVDHEVAGPCLVLVIQVVALGSVLVLGQWGLRRWRRHTLAAAARSAPLERR